jgi:thiamine-phosphate pyrophosphorylase
MLPDCTPAVERALSAAQARAQRRGAADVGLADVLAGLLEEEEGWAAVLLRRAGVEPRTVHEALATPAIPETSGSLATPPFSGLVLDTVVRAHDRSTERTADSGGLLVALLMVDAELRRTLEAQGLKLAALEAQLAESAETPVPLEEPLHLAEPTELIDTARILDANANRAREALRVIEDYCRFVLNDAFLSGELKHMRHELTDILELLRPRLMLEARETQQDVGTRISTAQEWERSCLREVAKANLKRLQEALRSLEEFAKVCRVDLAARLEQLRYRSYTLERAVVLGADTRQRLADARLYVLLNGKQCQAALDWTIRECAAGGVSMVQLREKHLSDRALLERARDVRRWTRAVGVLFIMNDRPDIARLAEADGVHVGQDELTVRAVRRIVGPDVLIGVSTHNPGQLRQAILDGASYVGVGPAFPSQTKDFAAFPGLDFVRQATAETSLPAFVIGGITPENIGQAVAAGARRVAVGAAICGADDPCRVATELRRLLPD